MKVCWFSTGVSSFVACYLAKDIDKIIYTHVTNQHPDSIRFLHDCEKILNREIEILQSDKFKNVEDVIRATGILNTPYGAPCTRILKKEVRKKWEWQHGKEHTYVWGLDCNETERANRIIETMPEQKHEFPLIEHNLSKENVHAIAKRLGLKRPVMYDLGYNNNNNNNNCIGCVKGGMGYWNKIRVDFPEVFEKRAKLEREVGGSMINGVYLDELDPSRGRGVKEIMPDCGISCEILI